MSGFPGYELLEPLGEGPSGRTWRARSEKDGREVALKTPRAERSSTEELARARAALLSMLGAREPIRGVTSLLDVTAPVDGGIFGVVSELAEGRDLREVVAGIDLSVPGRLESLLRVYEQLAHVLASLHARGLVHGGLGPGDVVLGVGDRVGQVSLLDLHWSRAGLARLEAPPPETLDGSPPRPASDQWLFARLVLASAPAWPEEVEAILRRPLTRAASPVLAERFPRIEQVARVLEAARLELAGSQDLPRSSDAPTLGLEVDTTEGRSAPPRVAGTSDAVLLDAASLAPTIETEKVSQTASAPTTGDVSLSVDLSRESGPPSLATPRLGSTDPTQSLAPPGAEGGARLPLLLAGLAALVAALGVALALWPSERPPRAPQTASAPTEAAPLAPTEAAPLAPTEAAHTAPIEAAPAPTEAAPPAPTEAAPLAPTEAASLEPGGGPTSSRATPRGRRRCRSDTPLECRTEARAALRRGRPERARRLYERACDARDASACAALAELWADGLGGPPRARTAAAFWRRACALGHTESCER